MVSKGLLTWVLVAEASVLSASVVLLAVHSIWTWWHTRWSRPVLAMARAILRDALEEPLPPKTAVELLDSLPAAVQIGVFADLAIGVAGEQRQRLAAIAVELGLSARAEARCHSRLWWRQLRGARLVTLVGTGEEVMPTLLRDRYPVIRAQAAEWAAEHPSPALAAELVAMLGDSSGLCRFAAQDSLMRMGDVVAEPLVEYLSARSGERVAAALSVAVGLADPRFLNPATLLCRDGSAQVRRVAATVVGALGGGRAVEVLTELLSDPAEDVRASAARSLGKLGYWPSTISLAPLLHDDAWPVRRDAALALRAMDAPGLLVLRRSLSNGDRLASDIARQVLDMPEALESALPVGP